MGLKSGSKFARGVQIAIGVAISATFLWFAFRGVEFAAVWASMRAVSPLGVLAVALTGVLGIVSRGQRWVPLFRPETGVTARDAFVAQAVGFAGNTVLPFRAGEALKAYALGRRTEQPFTKVLATVVLERVFDLAGVGATLALALALVPIPEEAGPQVGGAVRLLGFVAVSSVLGVIAFVFLRDRMLRIVDAVLGYLPAVVAAPARGAVHAFVDGLDTLGNPRQFVRALLLTLWVWGTLTMPFAAMSVAFGFGSDYGASALEVGVVCAALVAVFVMIPAAPGFVGTFQAGCIVALAIFGVPREPALAFALLVHLSEHRAGRPARPVLRVPHGAARPRRSVRPGHRGRPIVRGASAGDRRVLALTWYRKPGVVGGTASSGAMGGC